MSRNVRSADLEPPWPLWWLILLYGAVILAVWWPVLTLPFLQDDWAWLSAFQAADGGFGPAALFDPTGKLFFRPVSETGLFILFTLFGTRPALFHLLALGVHLANTLLVWRGTRDLTDSPRIARLAGLVYATALAIHLDPLSWAVGLHDLGGMFFFLAALAFFLHDRPFLSAAAYLLGSLCKESVLVLPAILAVLEISRWRSLNGAARRSLVRALSPHAAVAALLLGLRLVAGESPLALSPAHPYVLDPLGGHILQNLYRYAGWLLQSVVPFGVIQHPLFRVLTGAVLILGMVTAVRSRNGLLRRRLAALFLWGLLALLPVLGLPHHAYRYYAVYALPAFVGLLLLLLREWLARHPFTGHRDRVLTLMVAVVVLFNIGQSHRLFHEGLSQHTLVDGTNRLIHRAAVVETVRAGLRRQLPRPPAGAVLLLGGVDLWAFHKDDGPRVWYGDPTLRVYDLADLRRDDGGLYVQSPIRSQTEAYIGPDHHRIRLAGQPVFAFRETEGSLSRMPDAQLREWAASRTIPPAP